MDLTLFNPQSQKEEDFLAAFVARNDVLKFLLRQLLLQDPGQSAQHHLIVAPRGFGKTSLLRRVAIAIRTQPELQARFIALSFREEQYNVISLDVFWRNCLLSLQDVREDEGADDAELESIEATYQACAPRAALAREDQDGGPARQAFEDRCHQLGRRPVLLVDNLDALLAGLSDNHQWALRRTLQQASGPVLLAASSRYREQTQDAAAAFFDFFRIQTLDRLHDAEVMTCLRTLASHRGAAGAPVLQLLQRDPGRISALNTLAGGNPRTLGVLYRVLESHLSDDLLSQLAAMLDTFTGWYQARTEELPLQARAVFDALALHWAPLTAAGLAEATGLEVQTVSSQLTRLERQGFAEAVPLSTSGKGRSGYQVAERFFNIWYLMRNGPRRTRQQIKFLSVCLQAIYTPHERLALARRAAELSSADPSYLVALAGGMGKNSQLRHQLLGKAEARASELRVEDEYRPIIDAVRVPSGAKSKKQAINSSPEAVATGLLQTAANLFSKQQFQEALEVWNQLLLRFDGSTALMLRDAVSLTRYARGVTLGRLGREQEELEAYDLVLHRDGSATEPVLREPGGRALVNKGVALGRQGRQQEALEAYDLVLHRDGRATEPELREQVAMALVNKGNTLGRLGRVEEAMAAYDQVLQRESNASQTSLREQVAMALVNKGITLGRLGREHEVIAACDQVLLRDGTAMESALRVIVDKALINKGVALSRLGREQEEIKVYDQVVQRDSSAPEPGLREQVAKALVNKGLTLGQLGREQEELQAYEQVLQRDGDSTLPALRVLVAEARVRKGETLAALGRHAEAEEVMQQATAGEDVPPQSFISLGNLLLDVRHKPAQAVVAYQRGLATAKTAKDRAYAHANLAYALVLFQHEYVQGRTHAQQALETEHQQFSPAGRALLQALLLVEPAGNTPRDTFYSAIGRAIGSDDKSLWTDYSNDLLRLLGYAVHQGWGADLLMSMQNADYPLQQAPLYHAVCAAVQGADHLLHINAETREPATRLYQGLVQRLALFKALQPQQPVAKKAGRKPRSD
jgi:tetratricopeptide (TPR) repeat protein